MNNYQYEITMNIVSGYNAEKEILTKELINIKKENDGCIISDRLKKIDEILKYLS